MARLRVVSWNIERGLRLLGVSDVLKALKADLMLLTELDRGVARSRGLDVFSELCDRLSVEGHFAREFQELESVWRRIIPTGGPGGGVHGNAVLSRLAIEDYQVIDLPTTAPLSWEGRTLVPELFEPRVGRRIAQRFRVRIEGRPISVINTHLENWRCGWHHRRDQLCAALRGFFPGPREPQGGARLLAGDLNCLEGVAKTFMGWRTVNDEVPKLRAFLRLYGLSDPFADSDATCCALGTKTKLDWVASAGLRVIESQLLDTGLSDHACLVVDYELD